MFKQIQKEIYNLRCITYGKSCIDVKNYDDLQPLNTKHASKKCLHRRIKISLWCLTFLKTRDMFETKCQQLYVGVETCISSFEFQFLWIEYCLSIWSNVFNTYVFWMPNCSPITSNNVPPSLQTMFNIYQTQFL